jgi:hypothetical protein
MLVRLLLLCMEIHCCKGNILKMRCVARIVVSVGGITASREVVRLLIIVVVVVIAITTAINFKMNYTLFLLNSMLYLRKA